ncbi:hypothetical protein F9U64_05630 [Gracilibacillus oryzae]|uniref:DUF2953 domain-containing protein n=1 Tax=Gracilibacillus oryzae TaxID=1672701 RepID=A0A7C8L519_9BACI|nr:hypothetical protein [Gracilibacillus oryzae]KAB8138270.1 hypothetical protein F9U64_05630 [Gracilibacillus oryzae]
MLIIGIIIIAFLIIFLVLIGVLRVYAMIDWSFTEEEQQLDIQLRILGFTIMKKDLENLNENENNLSKHIQLKHLKYVHKFAIENIRFEMLKTKTIVGTGEPDTTAVLYGMLQTFFTIISAQLHDKGLCDCRLSANFEEAVIHSDGQCMISWKLRKTMRVWKRWKTKGE